MRHALATLAALLLVVSAATAQRDDSYRATVEKWRQEREASLKTDDGWLTVVGLFFLHEGDSRFGIDPLNDIVLPPGSAPGEVGVFEFRGGKTTVRVTTEVEVKLNGKPVKTAELRSDGAPEGPHRLVVGDLTLWVHESGTRRAIRVRDKNSKLRREFTGCRWFPVDEGYRVEGQLVPYDTPRKVEVSNILGDIEQYTSPGEVVFTMKDQELRMQALVSGRNRLRFIFRDLTSGKETYPAARFLYADAPGPDGKVIIDFNKALNPPCAFNPFTTCPLPPLQNRLRVRVEAGELDYHH